MNYKGAYAGGTSYNVGDVVVYTDGVAYEKIAASGSGVTPHNTRIWRRVIQPMQDVVLMFHTMMTGFSASISSNQTAANNISKMIAPEYSKKNYDAYDIVTHNGKLYYAKDDITSENWTASHWQETTVGAEISALQPEE